MTQPSRDVFLADGTKIEFDDFWCIYGYHTGDYWYSTPILCYCSGKETLVRRYAETIPGFRGFDMGGTEVTGHIKRLPLIWLSNQMVDREYAKLERKRQLIAEKSRIEAELNNL